MQETDANICDAMSLPVLFHELGHVDDFERGVNIIFGQPIDEAAAELYAHHYACKAMKCDDLRFLLKLYIEVNLDQHVNHSRLAQRTAARNLVMSGRFKDYISYIAPMYKAPSNRRELPDPDKIKASWKDSIDNST
ncbi:MAG: hypothetical protein H7144_00545 [Burkholderiales bacterium]|nr:hypothetical protein [Phycisphaerae bacterium]